MRRAYCESMSFDSTQSTDSYYNQLPAAYMPAKRRAKRRPANYASRSTAATLAKQAKIRELLESSNEGLTVSEIGRALGISRQLALYHVKKLAASYGCALLLEPCTGNGGLQYRVWDEMQLAAHYSRFLMQTFPARRAA